MTQGLRHWLLQHQGDRPGFRHALRNGQSGGARDGKELIAMQDLTQSTLFDRGPQDGDSFHMAGTLRR